MEIPELMKQAGASTVAVVRGVGRDRFGLPTPATDWDVRTVLNHVIHWTAYVSEEVASKRPTSDVAEPDYTSGDHAGDFAAQLDRAVLAWASPGALDGESRLGSGPAMPSRTIAGMLLCELVLHGWDLAVATDQPYDVPTDVLDEVERQVRGWGDLARSLGLFGPPADVSATAPPLSRVLGLSGRDPDRSA